MLPADTQACAAWLSLTWAMATRMEESRFLRSATSTGSSIVTTSVATTQVQRAHCAAGFSASAVPTKTSQACGCLSRNARQAGSVTWGPWSPPMQSTAIRTSCKGAKAAASEDTVYASGIGADGARHKIHRSRAAFKAADTNQHDFRRRLWSSGPCGHDKSPWG